MIHSPTPRLVNERILEGHVVHLVRQPEQRVESDCWTGRGRGRVHLQPASEVEVVV